MKKRHKLNPRLQHLAVYADSFDLFDHSISYDAIPRIVQSLNAGSALTSLAKISWLLEEWGDLDLGAQLFLAEAFFQGRALENSRKLILSEGRSIFFRAQIYILMKYVARYSKFERNVVNREELISLGMALAAIPGLMTSLLRRQRTGVGTQKPDSRAPDLPYLITELITNSYPARNLNGVNLGFILARAKHTYLNFHLSLKNSQLKDFIDIEYFFLEATGIPLATYLNVGIAIVTYFLSFHSDAREFPKNELFIFLQPHVMFKDASIETPDVNRIFDLISISVPELAGVAKEQNKRELAYDFLELRSKPLIRFDNELFLPISLSFLYERFSTGVFWIILDHLNRRYNRELSNRFTRYNGILFQRYVEEVLNQYTKRIKPPNELLILERTYVIGKQELRTPDVMLFGDNYLILIEASATRLQAKRTTSMGIPKAFEDDCEKMVFHNVKSLDTFISYFVEGKVTIEGFDCYKIKHIYPVVITIEGFPGGSYIDIFWEATIKERGLLAQECVRGLSILEIQDIELLEAYCYASLASVLKGWHSEPHRLIPKKSFYDYTKSLSEMSGEAISQWSNDFILEALKESQAEIFGKPPVNTED